MREILFFLKRIYGSQKYSSKPLNFFTHTNTNLKKKPMAPQIYSSKFLNLLKLRNTSKEHTSQYF